MTHKFGKGMTDENKETLEKFRADMAVFKDMVLALHEGKATLDQQHRAAHVLIDHVADHTMVRKLQAEMVGELLDSLREVLGPESESGSAEPGGVFKENDSDTGH